MKIYLDLLFIERSWSWTVIAIAYLLITLFVRQLAFRKLASGLKELDSGFYSATRNLYLRNSWRGWTIYLLSLLLVVVAWLGWRGPLTDGVAIALFCFLLPLLFFLSLILHLKELVRALLIVLRQRMGAEKEF